jgi:hypothetical protein
MVVKIDSHIVNAIQEYIASNGMEAQEFASEMGVSGACITKWGKVGNGITQPKWQVLFPKIKQFLPKERIYIDDSGDERYLSTTKHESNYVFHPKYVPAMVHLFPLQMLSQFDNMLQSATQFGMDMGATLVEYRIKHAKKNGIVAVKMDSTEYDPVIPLGTTMFACTGGEAPKNGGLVIVKNVDGKVIVARYNKNEKSFSLNDVVTGEPITVCDISSARKFIVWIFPVLYYEVVTF